MGKWIRIMDTPEADLEERQKSYLSNLLNEEWCKRTGEGLITDPSPNTDKSHATIERC